MEDISSIQQNRPSLSVIVPAHQGSESFRRCLLSLSQAFPPPNEIILVADGSGNGVYELAKEFGFKLLINPDSSGPARARNIGACGAQGDVLFFIDSDVAIPPDTIAKVQLAFAQDPKLAAVIGSYDDEPAAGNFLSQYKNLFHHYIHQTSNEEASTFWGACGAIRREVFMQLGGFDENYRRPSVEDIEFGSRIKKAGYRIRLSKTLKCKHLKRWGVLSLLKSDFFDRALPWTELIIRNRAFLNDLNLRFSSRISVVFIFCFIALLIIGFWQPRISAISMIIFAVFCSVNLPLYRFFYCKRGLWFMIRAFPWHCAYYVSCGLAFAIGLLRTSLRKNRAISGTII